MRQLFAHSAEFNAVAQSMDEHLLFIQYVGALYLIYTGVTMWRSSPHIEAHLMRGGLLRLFATGFLLNISNPEMPIFYLALLPGVLGIKPFSVSGTIELLLVIALIDVVVIGGHVALGRKAKAALTNPRKLRLLNRSTGGLMIGAGLLVASR